MNFELDAGVKALLPKLSDEERDKLDQNIHRAKRIRDRLIVAVLADENGKRILGDGYALEIGTKYKLDIPTEDMHFETRTELYQWVIDNQLGRRNLTDEQRRYYLGKEYQFAKQEHGGVSRFSASPQNEDLGKKTAETIAEKHGVSKATVERAADFAEAVDALPEPVREQVLNGQGVLSTQQIISGLVPKICKSCKKLPQPIVGCVQCKALRTGQKAQQPSREPGDDTEHEANEKARTKALPKPGSVIWDKRTFEEPFGVIVRVVDKLYKAYGLVNERGAVKEDKEHKELMNCLRTFKERFEARQKGLAK